MPETCEISNRKIFQNKKFYRVHEKKKKKLINQKNNITYDNLKINFYDKKRCIEKVHILRRVSY